MEIPNGTAALITHWRVPAEGTAPFNLPLQPCIHEVVKSRWIRLNPNPSFILCLFLNHNLTLLGPNVAVNNFFPIHSKEVGHEWQLL
jgi:hypothetical protein